MMNNTVFAQNSIITAPVQATKAIFQTNLETEINNAIVQIYGDVYAEEIQKRVMEIAQKAIKYGNQQARGNYDALKKSMATTQSTATSSSKPSGVNGKVIGIIVAIILILVCWFIGTTSDNSDKTNTRTCAWCRSAFLMTKNKYTASAARKSAAS